ncbi:APC family permease [Vibrio natriegens]|uniref:APC family permease n=1 Tax=Vibrio natriegens TaxID=691 RepID=UPI002284151F|nr:APC family permease [Vibrio natriegens]MCY9876919.1 APC family permease [Vibrio natriegens]
MNKGTENQGLQGKLGVASIVLMVVATAAPLTVMVASSPLMIMMGNGVAAPFDVLVATVIMLLFTIGFVAMSKYIDNAGAFYAYIQKGLGRSVGLGAASLAVISYFLILIALQAYMGYSIASATNNLLGISLPWWVYSLIIVGIIAFLGYRDIELSSKFLSIALILEISVVLVVDAVIFFDKGVTGIEQSAFHISNIISGSPGLGILFAIFSFIGFESTVIYREEADNPDKTIPRATYISVVSIGIFYVISIWLFVSGIGEENLTSYAELHGTDIYLALTEQYMGIVFMDLMHVLLITSLFACALSLHNIVVRYKYTFGRFGLISKKFYSVHEKYRSPHYSSFFLSVISVVSFVFLIAIQADPVTQIYAWGAMSGTLGYMTILCLTCLAVISFFMKNRNGENKFQVFLAPVLGFLGILTCLSIAVSNLPDLIGGDNAKSVSTLVVALLIAVFVGGFIAAQTIKVRYPNKYDALKQLA